MPTRLTHDERRALLMATRDGDIRAGDVDQPSGRVVRFITLLRLEHRGLLRYAPLTNEPRRFVQTT